MAVSSAFSVVISSSFGLLFAAGLPSAFSAFSACASAAVPNADTAAAILPGAASVYTVTIAGGESEIVNTVTLGNLIFGDAAPTLDVAGTLTFAGTSPSVAFLAGAIRIEGGGVLAGQGVLGNGAQGPSAAIVNNGTMIANAGTGTDLFVLVPFTNNGTLLANNGVLGVEGTSFQASSLFGVGSDSQSRG